MNYLSNRRLAKVKSHSVCEIRKIMEFPTLLLVKSCFPPVDTLKQISNELECQIIFAANIYLFKVTNRKTRKRCEIVQS